MVRWWLLAMFLMGSVGACDNPDKPEHQNKIPVVDTLTVAEDNITVGWMTSIWCHASDPDKDRFTYSWQATGGRLVPLGSYRYGQECGSTICWIAEQAGEHEITVTVSDSKGGNTTQSVHVTAVGPTGFYTVDADRVVDNLHYVLKSRKDKYFLSEMVDVILMITNKEEQPDTLTGRMDPEYSFQFWQDDVAVGAYPRIFYQYSNYEFILDPGESAVWSCGWNPANFVNVPAHEGVFLIRAQFIGESSGVPVLNEWVEAEVSFAR